MSSAVNTRKTFELTSERLSLRKLRFSDAEDIRRNANNKEVARWTISVPYPYTKDHAVRFIRKTHYGYENRKSYTFGIVLRKENKVIGTITLSKFDYKNKNAEIGYWLGKRYWKQGLMTEAVKLILKFGFRQLKLHRIGSGLFEENVASRRVLEKAGFKLEGKIRESRFRYGRWHNELRYGVLSSEYKSN